MTNLEQFQAKYTELLIADVAANPTKFLWAGSTVDKVAAKMCASFPSGGFNKDSDSIKKACKHFGIKHTYAAMAAFFKS